MNIRISAALLATLLLAACATAPGPGPGGTVPDMDRVASWLTGRFESQPGPGESVRRMIAVPILGEEAGRWIYVAQWRVATGELERQFVYRLGKAGERVIAVDIYAVTQALDNPIDPEPAALAGIPRESLERRTGCRIQLSPDGLSYAGGTRGRDCPADYRGAERLRIELTVREDEVREWLQGYDGEGNRLWGGGDVGRVYRRMPSS